MAEITVELVSVERMLWNGQATIVIAQTTAGEIGILPGHEPLLGQLVDHGLVLIRPVEGNTYTAAVHGGFLSVSQDKVVILADYAESIDEIDEAAAQEDLNSDDEKQRLRASAALRAVERNRQDA